jgi:hypothetical protein
MFQTCQPLPEEKLKILAKKIKFAGESEDLGDIAYNIVDH